MEVNGCLPLLENTSKNMYAEIVKGLKLSSIVVRSFKSFHRAPVCPRAAL